MFRECTQGRNGAWLSAGAAILLALALAPAARAEDDPAASMYRPDTVEVIDLTLPQSSIDALNADPEGDYQPGTFSMASTDGSPDGVGPFSAPIDVGIRLKGQVMGSFQTLDQKAAFKVKFNYVKGQQFLGLKKMTLNNMVEDPSMIHERLAYEAFSAAGVQGPRTGYAYVRVNGQDYGLYLNVETLDDVALAKRFGSFDDPQHLYEGAYGSDVTPGGEGAFEVDEGDENDVSDLTALIAKVNDGAPDWSTEVSPVADLLEMTRYWAVEKYIGFWDGYAGRQGPLWPNNFYLYSDPDGVFQMLPWGTDQTWDQHIAFDGAAGVMFDDCLEDESCAAMYQRSLREVGEWIAGLGLDSAAEQTATLLQPWEALDPRRPYSLDEIQSAVAATRAFIASRPQELADWLATQPAELPPSHVDVALQPDAVLADGASTTTATATVTDDDGNPVPGDEVELSSSDPDEQVGPVSENGDGTYTATITSSTRLGPATITATDSASPGISGEATLYQHAGPPAHVSLLLSPTSIPADGASTTTATVSLTDAQGRAPELPELPQACGTCLPLDMSSSDPGQGFGIGAFDVAKGVYTVRIRSSERAGPSTITATYDRLGADLSASATLTETATRAQGLANPPADVGASGSLMLGRVTRNTRRGTAELSVTPSGPGELDLSGPRVVGRQAAAVSAAAVPLSIVARGSAARSLRKAGRATVVATVSFQPPGGATASEKSIRLTLIRR